MDTAVQLLKKFSLFYAVSDELLTKMGELGIEKTFKKDECIFSEGEQPGLMGLIIEGRIKVVKHSPEGKDVIIRIIEKGQIFGEVAVFDNRPYPASAVAMECTRTFILGRNKLIKLINDEPQVALDIISDLGRKLRDMLAIIRNIATEHVDKRIVFTFLKIYEQTGTSVLKLKRQDIAEMCGTTVETAIRVTRQLEKNGYIQTKREKITLININALKNYVEKK